MQDQQPNFSYLSGDEPAQLVAALADLECFKGSRMQQLKALLDRQEATLSAQRVAELAQAKEAVQTLKSRLCNMAEFSALTLEQQQQLTQPFAVFSEDLTQQKLIAVMREDLRRFEETTYQRSLSKLMDWLQPAPPSGVSSSPPDEPKPATVPAYGGAAIANPEVRVVAESKIVLCKAVKVDFDTPLLASEADVDRYLAAMREALLAEIQNGKRIQI